jgi:hypothetical protein
MHNSWPKFFKALHELSGREGIVAPAFTNNLAFHSRRFNTSSRRPVRKKGDDRNITTRGDLLAGEFAQIVRRIEFAKRTDDVNDFLRFSHGFIVMQRPRVSKLAPLVSITLG